MNKQMEYLQASRAGFDVKKQMSRLFVEGFYKDLKWFSKDMERLIEAFEHIFLVEHFYVAINDGKVASMVALTGGKIPLVALDKKILRKHLGFLRGSFAYLSLTKFLVNRTYPFPVGEKVGNFEFVATASEFRSQGVAFGLMKHLRDATDYESFVLEVAKSNTPARKLYEQKLGFSEFCRVKGAMGSGDLLYLGYGG